jgi:hypothetical protein
MSSTMGIMVAASEVDSVRITQQLSGSCAAKRCRDSGVHQVFSVRRRTAIGATFPRNILISNVLFICDEKLCIAKLPPENAQIQFATF